MRLPTLVLTGVAMAGVAGLALAAVSAKPQMHEMTVQLPDGGVAHVRYIGNVPPKLNFVQTASPFTMTGFGPGFSSAEPSPFAEIERIHALMDRRMAAMMYQARLMQRSALADPLTNAAAVGTSPDGLRLIARGNGNYCMRSVQITASANGGAPKVISHTEGNCGDAPAASPQAKPSATPQPSSAEPLQTISYQPARIAPSPQRGI